MSECNTSMKNQLDLEEKIREMFHKLERDSQADEQMIDAVVKLFQAEILKVIGEDEEIVKGKVSTSVIFTYNYEHRIRNGLRSELRRRTKGCGWKNKQSR